MEWRALVTNNIFMTLYKASNASHGGEFSVMSDISLQVTLQFSEELLCRSPEQRNDDDILKVLSWVRHKCSLFKNLEDGKS